MFDDALREALDTLNASLEQSSELTPALSHRWRHGPHGAPKLDDAVAAAAQVVDDALLALCANDGNDANAALKAAFDASREVVFLWCAANTPRTEAELYPLLRIASADPEYAPRVVFVARNRVVMGPLADALRCAPLLGRGDWVGDPRNHEASARIEILLWEAGAQAIQLPELGKWLWGDATTFESVVATPARGSLRGRVLAARCLEVTASGMPPMTDPQLVGRTLQVLQPLLLHPEPMVWVHAARAFGRLAGAFEPLEGTLLDWVHGATPVLRQRALTAFASLPKSRLRFLGHELESILERPEEAAWGLAAAAAATPHLYRERSDLWVRLAGRILDGDGGAVASRALARGIATLWRAGDRDDAIASPFRTLRLASRRVAGAGIEDLRRWLEVVSVTDRMDNAERDPLDIETGLENLVRLAAQYDDQEADARAARFAGMLAHTFSEARQIAQNHPSARQRAAALNAVEGSARSLALRLWGPLLATEAGGEGAVAPDLEATWNLMKQAPAELLDYVRELRLEDERDEEVELSFEVLALKLGGYALDACGEERTAQRGPTAHDTCLWLRKLEGLSDGSRQLPEPLERALSALFWRLVDTTRGTALGEVDDVQWLGPFAAWWALVIDRPAVLARLANALPMIREDALSTCLALADEANAELARGAADGAWWPSLNQTLKRLHADETELGKALEGFAAGLAAFGKKQPDLDTRALELVMASERLQSALSDPVRALHPAKETAEDDSLRERLAENAPRTAKMLARAIRSRDLSLLEVWFASLGPTAATLVEAALKETIRRIPPPPPAPKKKQPKTIVGYELIKPLGEGGIGSVWLVRKPGADRYFVLKIPKKDVLESATDTEREGILASFHEEAKALAGLYHPNVANIIDRGVDGEVPYLVLEYLIGADLKMYSTAKHMTLPELPKVVQESCAGLTALHNAGLVHRDIKPANLWLRLPLRGGERFDPEKHRDPRSALPLSTVLIDFGMVRAMQVPEDVGGRFVAGTPGYIAPEQVLDPTELDGRADVYSLAGTIYNVMTGRTFFDEIADKRERIVAHMRRDAMEDSARFKDFPPNLVRLLRSATAMNWKDRPTPLEFGNEFAKLG